MLVSYMLRSTCVFLLLLIRCGTGDDKYKYDNWKFHFIPGSGMGLFMALAVPVDLPNKNLYLAYNFEANYMLPGNESYYEYPPLIQRRVDRQLVYDAIETKMNSTGFPGKACLLRTICESSLGSVQHHNGVLGDILHIVFTPSTSENGNLASDYENAENMGRKTNDCTRYHNNCKVSFLGLISWFEKSS